jgi:hypothetical protein
LAWFLPSRLRPANVERLAKAWVETGASTPLVLRLDEDDALLGVYRTIELPKGWEIVVEKRLPLGEIYNEFYQRRPYLDWFGFIADDVVPETKFWDRELLETADVHGIPGMAVPAGGETTGGTPHFVIAGSLAREQGWLCLPGLNRLYIDRVWREIAQGKGVLRHRPDVTLKHHHFSNNLALLDSVYRKPLKETDRALFEAWRETRKEERA